MTDGLYNIGSLLEGNNAGCYLLQMSLAVVPDEINPLLGAVGSVLGFVTSLLGPLGKKLQFSQLREFNSTIFNQFPGASYKGEGQ